MIVRKLRLQRGWSQDQLAEFSGLSVRTIQRAERGQKASLETVKALASVFEVDISTFNLEGNTMQSETAALNKEEIEALTYAKRVKNFYEAVFTYIVLVVAFGVMISLKRPELFSNPLLYLIFGAAGLGTAVQGLIAFEIIRLPWTNLEKRIAEKKLGRKL